MKTARQPVPIRIIKHEDVPRWRALEGRRNLCVIDNSAAPSYCPGMGTPMALMRGAVVGYDADKMCFRFTMMDGLIAIDCEISNAALVELGGTRWTGKHLDHAAQFAEYRDAIEEIASRLYDAQTDRESRRVRIFSKHLFKSKK